MSDGRPYGPFRYKELVRECYFITKNTSTPYEEVLDRTFNKEYLTNMFNNNWGGGK